MALVDIYFPGNLASVRTVTALRALPSFEFLDGQDILTQGGTTFADGGGAIYVWVAASTSTDNGLSVIKPSDITSLQAGRWILVLGSLGIGSINTDQITYGTQLLTARLNQEYDLSLARLPSDDPDETDNLALERAQVSGYRNLKLYPGKGSGDDGVWRIGRAPYVPGTESNTPPTLQSGNIIRDGVTISGGGTVDQMNRGTMFNIESLSSVVANNIKRFTIRDMDLQGFIVRDGYSEQTPIIAISGGSDVLIENNRLIGARGDAVYLPSSFINGVERHNERATIRNNFIDGVNKDNRCALAVVDGVDVWFINNYVTRHTRPGGVNTGPVDFEPEVNAFHRVMRGKVNFNTFIDCNGSALALLLKNPAFFNGNCYDFEFIGNIVQGMIGAVDLIGTDPTTVAGNTPPTTGNRFGLIASFNKVRNCTRMVRMEGWFGLALTNNHFTDCGTIYVNTTAYTSDQLGLSREISINDNTFVRCGQTDGAIVQEDYGSMSCQLMRNRMIDCGRTDNAAGFGFLKRSGNADWKINDNYVENPRGLMKRFAQQDAGTVSASAEKLYNRFTGTVMTGDTFNPASTIGVTGSQTFASAVNLTAAGGNTFFDVPVSGASKTTNYKANFAGAYTPASTDVYTPIANYSAVNTVRVFVENRSTSAMTFPIGTILTVTQDI